MLVLLVYYKQCAIFIFVYDLTDRKSFEALGQEIDAIQEELGKKHYDMYLVGSHSDKEERRVHYKNYNPYYNNFNTRLFLMKKVSK